MEYKDKKVIVLGFGKTGEAVSAYLAAKGATVMIYDDRLSDGKRADLCGGCDFAVISPGFPTCGSVAWRLREQGVPILSELDLAYIHCPSARIFAVSGTNGKTTTCTILHEMLSSFGRCHLVGNIGTPFISEVDRIAPKDAVVVEVSSFQIEQSVVFRPRIAALTNVGEDHLDRHRDAKTYKKLKLSFAERAKISVVNRDDPAQKELRGIGYSVYASDADYRLAGRAVVAGGKSYPLPPKSRGEAFDRDFLCAFAVACSAYGYKSTFLSCYDRLVVPRYRFEKIGSLFGATVINDSKGTNVDAALFALSLCDNRTAIILGGSDKGEDYSRLMNGMDRAERIYLVGANARDLYLAAREETRRKCLPMADLESAVQHFVSDPLDTLLFSPACASFDRYRNYEERGRAFDAIVEKYRGN